MEVTISIKNTCFGEKMLSCKCGEKLPIQIGDDIKIDGTVVVVSQEYSPRYGQYSSEITLVAE